ncbi:Mac1p SCDLUD_004182 [Saccharomycodes ludwigii]|uniref:Mac1p n=1 Tax=Saccharomycodes ludwigii TaxID=36035 RepID=UPI001E88714B|nr:hypothetical protein SCDLUD_004182 [Saccharomycodes ludwigii]KAH3899882.1 hypothetical protein SCDLUD_004182 [Saccharomycodes ludwigii]
MLVKVRSRGRPNPLDIRKVILVDKNSQHTLSTGDGASCIERITPPGMLNEKNFSPKRKLLEEQHSTQTQDGTLSCCQKKKIKIDSLGSSPDTTSYKLNGRPVIEPTIKAPISPKDNCFDQNAHKNCNKKCCNTHTCEGMDNQPILFLRAKKKEKGLLLNGKLSILSSENYDEDTITTSHKNNNDKKTDKDGHSIITSTAPSLVSEKEFPDKQVVSFGGKSNSNNECCGSKEKKVTIFKCCKPAHQSPSQQPRQQPNFAYLPSQADLVNTGLSEMKSVHNSASSTPDIVSTASYPNRNHATINKRDEQVDNTGINDDLRSNFVELFTQEGLYLSTACSCRANCQCANCLIHRKDDELNSYIQQHVNYPLSNMGYAEIASENAIASALPPPQQLPAQNQTQQLSNLKRCLEKQMSPPRKYSTPEAIIANKSDISSTSASSNNAHDKREASTITSNKQTINTINNNVLMPKVDDKNKLGHNNACDKVTTPCLYSSDQCISLSCFEHPFELLSMNQIFFIGLRHIRLKRKTVILYKKKLLTSKYWWDFLAMQIPLIFNGTDQHFAAFDILTWFENAITLYNSELLTDTGNIAMNINLLREKAIL